MNDVTKVDDGQVVSIHYTLQVEGQIVDSSEGGDPLQFIQGMGHILPGLEHKLYDMTVGETRKVVVAPKDGYGEPDSEAFMDVPRGSFPPSVPLARGTELELRDQADHPIYARIDSISDTNVRLNMNHPLAGKELHFDVTIADIRPATDDEISHGHVHLGGDHS